MAHTIQNKQKLINRVKRIKGQIEAIQKALENEQECSLVLNTIVASRGALNGLLMQVLEGHIQSHLTDPAIMDPTERTQAGQQLIDLLKSYIS